MDLRFCSQKLTKIPCSVRFLLEHFLTNGVYIGGRSSLSLQFRFYVFRSDRLEFKSAPVDGKHSFNEVEEVLRRFETELLM